MCISVYMLFLPSNNKCPQNSLISQLSILIRELHEAWCHDIILLLTSHTLSFSSSENPTQKEKSKQSDNFTSSAVDNYQHFHFCARLENKHNTEYRALKQFLKSTARYPHLLWHRNPPSLQQHRHLCSYIIFALSISTKAKQTPACFQEK